ncbi:MAG TPA: trypsin-like peptidase domain-containing protein [Candidatus Limivivens intestinipullorum]|uniref:Trypsin-like peptidase domain-containing protein n=1 Tax=Candidatus Limivivens intestinipullorum TaxID=2840858 RepID=A0A9D1JJY0_9FIRM|nr:trypsin-like peptidase domain-containing protein [Candidatus Limivivens intestinipullorum]
MFDKDMRKDNTEIQESENTQLQNKESQNQESESHTAGHYQYEKETDEQIRRHYQPQDHKRKSRRHSSARTMGIAAAMALVFGMAAGATYHITGNMADRAVAAESTEAGSGQIAAAGTVNESKAAQAEAVSQDTTDETAEADTGSSEVQTAETVSAKDSSSDTSGNTVADVAENSMPFMVAITNESTQTVINYFNNRQYSWPEESTGSGVIIGENDDELLIVTNNHVVADADSLTVCFSATPENEDDAEEAVVEALVKGTDSTHDVAVVAVKLADIPDWVKSQIRVASFGDSSELRLGEQVVAIGNALGYGQSVTSGYISALNRDVTIDGLTNSMIQTDAAINGGNSGGALLNMNGEVIGINSAKTSGEGVEGMGYALPSNTVAPIVEELSSITTRERVTDSSEQGYMGITPEDISEETKELYNIPSGTLVYYVEDGSAADEAGLQRGDIITSIDGIAINSSDELYNRMEYYKAGEQITLTIERQTENGGYEEMDVTLTLGNRPDSQNTSSDQGSSDSSDSSGDGSQDVSPFEQMFPELFN